MHLSARPRREEEDQTLLLSPNTIETSVPLGACLFSKPMRNVMTYMFIETYAENLEDNTLYK